MPGPGRNQPCPCGSGRKVKRCCGEQRGPAQAQLERAFVAQHARWAAEEIGDLPTRTLAELWKGLADLPDIDLSLVLPLPTLITPELAAAPTSSQRRRPRPRRRRDRHRRRHRRHAPTARRARPRGDQPPRRRQALPPPGRRSDHRPRKRIAGTDSRQPHQRRLHQDRTAAHTRRPTARRLTVRN